MTQNSKSAIALGTNLRGAETAKAYLNNIGFAEINIRTTVNPQDILNLSDGEVELVAIQTHPTNMSVWKSQLPLCNHLKQVAHINHVIIKANV
jgi:hypothetical protein